MRVPLERIPIYNRKGRVKKYEDYDWFHTLMLVYNRPDAKRTPADDLEDATDLKAFKPGKQEKTVEKESLQGYKQSADFVLEQHLRREEALLPGAQPVKTFTAGKGDKAKDHPVYLRSDIAVCKTVESWHKEGRAIRMGEQPLKYVPMRAVTLVRKREIEDAQRETGEKLKQGLYSEAQTEWIIPPPIQNGVIPRNAFGNMDVYVPTMVPEGAVHLPLKGTAKICRKLEIDYAEACTGFEFGKQRAVPILTGVVVARENERLVKDAWRVQREEERRKEDTKRTATALHWWRKMLLGLRVLERMRVEYADAGGKGEEVNPFVRRAEREGRSVIALDGDDEGDADGQGAGGFLMPGEGDEEESKPDNGNDGGGFLVEDGGGFSLEEPSNAVPNGLPKAHAPITPVSLQSMHKTADNAADSEDESANDNVMSSTTKGRRHLSKSKPKPRTKNTQSTNGRKKIVLSSDSDSSSLSDATDSDFDVSDVNSDGAADSMPTPPVRGNSRVEKSSPQVVVSPAKKARAAKKSTPVRSQYFDHSDEAEDGIDSEGGEEEVEVVKPRRTTARTKGRAYVDE
jgi:xeroderma pigmentosum group C-complementing protein